MSKHQLYYGDNLEILQAYVSDESINLIYIDPPFNTGKAPKAYGDPGRTGCRWRSGRIPR